MRGEILGLIPIVGLFVFATAYAVKQWAAGASIDCRTAVWPFGVAVAFGAFIALQMKREGHDYVALTPRGVAMRREGTRTLIAWRDIRAIEGSGDIITMKLRQGRTLSFEKLFRRNEQKDFLSLARLRIERERAANGTQ